MFKKIDHQTHRALQICLVFVVTLALQRWFAYTHAGWIGFAVMMIYADFESGSSVHRTFHRFFGAMYGLVLSGVLFYIIRLDYHLILLIIPIVVFMAFFSLGKNYAYPTVFTVTLTALGADYYSNEQYDTYGFFFDYSRSTIIALGICLCFEYFIFNKNKPFEFYLRQQRILVTQLNNLLSIVLERPIRHSQFLKLTTQLNANVIQLNSFLQIAKQEYRIEPQYFDFMDQFHEAATLIYQNICQIFSLETNDIDSLLSDTKKELNRLALMSEGEKFCR